MNKKLVFLAIPAADPKRASEGYARLFGVDFARSLTDEVVSYHTPISNDGVYMMLQQRHTPEDKITPFFAVDDLSQAVQEVEAAGGQLVDAPRDLPVSQRVLEPYRSHYRNVFGTETTSATLGSAAVVRDSEGNLLGLVQVQQDARVLFRLDDEGNRISDELLSAHAESIEIGRMLEQ